MHFPSTPRNAVALGMALFAIATATPAVGQVTLFADSFARTTQPNEDIDADSTGMGGTLGSLIYVENGDTIAGSATSTNIAGDALHLAVGPNASALYLGHNFVDPAISTQGGFSIRLDIVSNDGTAGDTERYVGFGVGGSLTEFTNQTQLDNNATAAESALRGNFGTASNGFADLWVGYSPNSGGSIQVFRNGNSAATFDNDGSGFGTPSGQTLEVQFSVSDFNQGSPVGATILFGGVEVGQQVFTWDNTGENYIGINARQDSNGFTVDNLDITALFVEPPATPILHIDRESGNITLDNLSNSAIDLIGYTIQTSNGAFDTSQWDKVDTLDTNDTWEQLTAPGNPSTDLSEATLGAGYTVDAAGGANDSINFGNVWIRSPYEDFSFEFRNADGDVVPVSLVVTGNNGAPFLLGDFDFMNGVDAADWAILRGNLISDPSEEGLLTYHFGDINEDGLINEVDFDQFKIAFDEANGAGAFTAMLSGQAIPEPSTIALLAIAGMMAVVTRGRRTLLALVGLMLVSGFSDRAMAQTNLFSDSFDRSIAQQDDIDATSTGMSGVGAPMTYIENGDAIAPNGPLDSLTNLESNQLHLADGNDASSVYLDRNFADMAIIADGVLSIKMDLVSNDGGSTSNNEFIGFGIGSTLAENQGQTLLDFNATTIEPAIRGNLTAGTGFADLWVGWSPTGNGTVQIIQNGRLTRTFADGVSNATSTGGNLQPSEVDGVGATLELRMAVDSFTAGKTVAATVYYNGNPLGGDAFRWDNTNANYIGITARQGNDGIAADNLAITTSADPLDVRTLSLEVHTDTGEVFLVGAPIDLSIDRYTISSNGGLENASFDGIGGDAGLPAGDGSGNGWELGGVQTDSLLNEFYLGTDGQGGSLLNGNLRASLGFIYDTTADTRDLIVEYRLLNGNVDRGAAVYMLAPIGTPGDFNDDGIVNLADYTVWRDNLGSNTPLDNDHNLGTPVGSAHYTLWKNNFGQSGLAAGTAQATSVPEPATLLLVAAACLPFVLRRARQQ